MKTEINTTINSSRDKHYFNTEQIKALAILFHVNITEGFFLPNHKSPNQSEEGENEAKLY